MEGGKERRKGEEGAHKHTDTHAGERMGRRKVSGSVVGGEKRKSDSQEVR